MPFVKFGDETTNVFSKSNQWYTALGKEKDVAAMSLTLPPALK